MTDNENLNLTLTCAICLDIASPNDAVETTCCHQLFCLACMKNVQRCPTCRKADFQTVPAYFARRIIGNLTVLCPNDGCQTKINRSDLANHLAIHCVYKKITCPDPQCNRSQYTKKLFLEHLTTKHEKLLFGNFDKLWQNQADSDRMTTDRSNKNLTENAPELGNNTTFDDRIERTRNKFGRYARLGSNGKFYCGGQLDGPRCSCCNGYCGPSNGCNCSACMLLDVEKQKLSRGWLVNRDGGAARCSSAEPTKFHCGRMVMTHDTRTDGYCGPTNGEQCIACQRLNEQQYQRYGQVWAR